MALPLPKPGLVVRYDYLWSREAEAGRQAGKDRPACIVATVEQDGPAPWVLLLPITHSPPLDDTIAIEIPAKVKQSIGLDDLPSWVVISEYNIDTWPAGLSALPGHPGTFAYGFLPPGLFQIIQRRFVEHARSRRSHIVKR
ncbi:hypothetical protein WI697_11730 [Tistrella mobilis]|jgi:hypothetical protein|uniref:hypothetical protein n=1 Tax=Tistrella mobilis TaxID=171437 RepID=UPI0031F6F2E3